MIKIKNIPIFAIDQRALDTTLFKIANDIRQLIRNRTLSGQDINHGQFQPYSDSYKKQKQAVGKKGQTVQLRDKGVMLASMKINKQVNKSVIWLDNRERALVGYIHQTGMGKMPKRYWFGLNQTDGDRIYKTRANDVKIGIFK